MGKGQRVQVFREGKKVGEGDITSLREGKAEVKQVDEENECGFSIQGWDAWQKGDEVRCYEVSKVAAQLVEKYAVLPASRIRARPVHVDVSLVDAEWIDQVNNQAN